MVNSLHGQGVDRLADGLEVEAESPDGVIEGIKLAGAKSFGRRRAMARRMEARRA